MAFFIRHSELKASLLFLFLSLQPISQQRCFKPGSKKCTENVSATYWAPLVENHELMARFGGECRWENMDQKVWFRILEGEDLVGGDKVELD